MEISLESIELVKDRTGVSYKEAKEALEFANGNVVDAIIYIEENINHEFEQTDNSSVDKIISFIKDSINKGNVTKIRIYHGDDMVVNLPVLVGAVATVAFPWGIVAAALASAVTKCRVEIVKEDGSIINVNEKASEVVDTVKDKGGIVVTELKAKGSNLYDTAKEKGADLYESVKEKGVDLYETAIEKGSELYENTKDKVTDYLEKSKETRIFDSSEINFEEKAGDDWLGNSGDDSSDNQ